METNKLKEQYDGYRAAHPKTRIRDIARALEVSEAELLMTRLCTNVTPLGNDFEAILNAIPALGKVMTLTRNDKVCNGNTSNRANDQYRKISGRVQS